MLYRTLLSPPASSDRNANRIPDECSPRFRRGDANQDGAADLSDAVFTLRALFLGTAPPVCADAADVNDDGVVDISDAVALLGHLFLGTATPPAPFLECGVDPTVDKLPCAAYSACR